VLARQSVPGLGAQCSPTAGSGSDSYAGAGQWQISIGYRWQRSHRHFVGQQEQKQREEQQTEIVNNIHLMDFGATYSFSQRFNLTFSVPILFAERTRPGQLDRLRGIPNAPDQVSHSAGIGDVALTGRFWLIRPPSENRQNISIGFGLKLPTGDPGTKSTVDTVTGPSRRVNDQSIQPGDGGVGIILDTQAFKGLGRTTVFFSGTYLINPRNTNGVETGRTRPSEAIMSVADQYLARVGIILPVPKAPRLALSLGGRIEGVPVRDLLGKSEGFRRPGYAISADPGLLYFGGKNVWSVSVPIALSRNRLRSVTDIRDNIHGDAAFADYFITVGYTRRF
jgi:hypothetical protein